MCALLISLKLDSTYASNSWTALCWEGRHVLSPDDANKIIDTFLSPMWYFVSSQEDKDEIHRLANELRLASGQSQD